jgi:hypothetical protein
MAMAVAVIAATHPTTTLAATAGGSFGRDERGGANGGDSGDSKNRLADHRSLLALIGCVLTSCLVRRANDPAGSTASGFVSLKSTIS